MDSNADLIQDFVARSGTRFVVQARNGSHGSCETFYFAGANAYYLVRPQTSQNISPGIQQQSKCRNLDQSPSCPEQYYLERFRLEVTVAISYSMML